MPTPPRRILMRAAKDPFAVASAATTLQRNLIATNVGNLLFSHAAYRMLSRPDTEVVANGPSLNGNPADADRINEEFDAFVVPLANAFRPEFVPQLARLTALVEKLTIPVTVLGVGAQTDLDYGLAAMRPLDEGVSRFMRAVLDRSPSVGVRGELTERYLNDLGFRDVEVIGCPSMFLHGREMAVRDVPAVGRDSRVALSITNSVPGIGALVDDCLDEQTDVTYFAQELKDLRLMVWGDLTRETQVAATVPDRSSHRLLAEGRVSLPLDPATWVDALRSYDVAAGTRIHGNVAALLAGTPALVVCHDSRTLELCRYFDIPYVRADRVERWKDVTAALGSADFGPLVAGHQERLDRMLGFVSAHGLAHAYEDGGDEGRAFDERTAATSFAPPAGVWDGSPDDLLGYRVASLRAAEQDQAARLREQAREVVRLRRRAEQAEARAAELATSLTAQTARIDRLGKRLAAIEREATKPSVPVRAWRKARRSAGAIVRRGTGRTTS